jgi:xanthine dehydrogenase accessory factor
MKWLREIPAQLQRGPCVLITVAGVRGSAPREAGASMLVSADALVDTLGGGHLEWEAIAEARARLLTGQTAPALRRYALAASLGQCCGGVVWLCYETLTPERHTDWLAVQQRLAQGTGSLRVLRGDALGSTWTDARRAGNLQLPSQPDGQDWCLTQPVLPPDFCLTIHGAGHVGQALVAVLAPLALALHWHDMREDLLAGAPAGVITLACDTAEEAVAQSPSGSHHLVLTHDHALDLALVEALLRRKDIGEIGLIGSASKWTRFRQKLAARGFAEHQIARITCPIGVRGSSDKSPQAIAIMVAAQVLRWREQARTPHQALPEEPPPACLRSQD